MESNLRWSFIIVEAKNVCTHDNLLYRVTVLDIFLIANIYKIKRKTEKKKKKKFNLCQDFGLVHKIVWIPENKKKSEHSDKTAEKHSPTASENKHRNKYCTMCTLWSHSH